jgi:hypothetical protein
MSGVRIRAAMKQFPQQAGFALVQSPDVRPILEIHRGGDGYITFARLDNGIWREWGKPVMELETIFPEFAADLIQDSYFSINSFWQPRRQTEDVRWLNAAFVDVDCVDSEDLGQRLGMTVARADRGEIPKPSCVVFSGRGFWLLWLLVGNDSKPPQGIWVNRVYYDQIERELVARCQADPKVKDIARVMRVPGSRNTKAGGKYVRFERYVGQDPQGHIHAYTLRQLGDLLGIAPSQMRPGRSGKRNPNFRGHVALWHHRYVALNQLRLRGGAFKEGCRHSACYLLAVTLHRIGVQQADVERDVFALARQCRPPLAEHDVASTIRSALRNAKKFREKTIMEWLNVTDDERAKIPHWRKASDNPTIALPKSERDAMIANIISDLGFIPSLRTMQRQLQERGFGASVETIRTTYRRLHPEFCLRVPGETLPLLSVPLTQGARHI